MGQRFEGDRPQKGDKLEDRMLADFSLYLQAAGIRSRLRYIMSVRQFLRFCAEGGIEFQGVKISQADAYRRCLLEQGKSRATVNNDMNRLRRFYRWLYRRRLIAEDPLACFRCLPTGRSLPKTILTVDGMGLSWSASPFETIAT